MRLVFRRISCSGPCSAHDPVLSRQEHSDTLEATVEGEVAFRGINHGPRSKSGCARQKGQETPPVWVIVLQQLLLTHCWERECQP